MNGRTLRVGQAVHYWPSGKSQKESGCQPLAATVAFVHGPQCVNLGYFDANGFACQATSVAHVAAGGQLPETGFCECCPETCDQASA